MKYFFGSDWHLDDEQILKYENRPFKSVGQMNRTIVSYHNAMVTDKDTYYFVGDASMSSTALRKYLPMFKGHMIYVCGNHDPNNALRTKNSEIILRIGGMKVQLVHNPAYARVDYPLIICGHVHSLWKTKELIYAGKTSLIVNVSVEVWDYRPVEWAKIETLYYRWKKEFDQTRSTPKKHKNWKKDIR